MVKNTRHITMFGGLLWLEPNIQNSKGSTGCRELRPEEPGSRIVRVGEDCLKARKQI